MSNNGKNSWRTQPMYSFREVSHLAGVSVSTVRNWLRGYSTEKGIVEPLFKGHPEDEKACSFLQLIEIVVAAKFRKAEHKSFRLVRRVYDNARALYKLDYPFASLELKAIGGHIVRVIRVPGAILQAMDQPEQFTLPDLVQETLAQIEYEYDLAARWWPVGKKIPIVVDPQISAGLPVIKGRGITVEIIYNRFKKADQKLDFIARDFELEFGVVEEVIRYAEKVAI